MIDLLAVLDRRPVIAILRASRPEYLLVAAERLLDAGVTTLELTLTTPGALDALETLRDRHGSAVVGAGTVRTPELARRAADAGAQFLVSQLLNPAVIALAHERRLPMVPGCLTPNEIAAAWEQDVTAVKISPVGPVGGADYLREVRAPMPEVPLIATGGVAPGELSAYLRAGAVAVGLSARFFEDALETGETAVLATRARAVVREMDELDHHPLGHRAAVRMETPA